MMTRTTTIAGIVLLLLPLFFSDTASAQDSVQLKSGRILRGKVSEGEAEKGGPFILLETHTGAVYKLDKGDIVESIMKREQADIDYETRLKHVRDIATDHIEIAKWCEKQKKARGKTRFKEQIRWHYENVVRLDPDHASARKKLGYMKLEDGTWVAEAEFKSRQGYIPDRRRDWVAALSKEVELEGNNGEDRQGARKKELNRWFANAKRGRYDAASLAAICDSSSFVLVYKNAIEVTEAGKIELARVHLDAISTVKNELAIRMISHFAMAANSKELREHAISLLSQKEMNQTLAVLTLKEGLQSTTSRWIVHNSAFAIAEVASSDEFSRDHAILPLAAALVTEHTERIAGALEAGRMNPSFGTGGSGLQMGGGPQTRQIRAPNRPSLDALRRLCEVDFEYNADAWTEWYIDNYTLADLNIREDE